VITWNCQRCGDHRHAPCGKPICGQGDDNLANAIDSNRRARGELAANPATGNEY